MKSKYYEAELAYLRQSGREFARTYPNSAGLLAERSADPDVERLLEGFAFLASRIRQRADDAVPEIAQAYASIVVPQLTRFVPPMTTVQFRPEQGLRTLVRAPRGTPLSGVTAGGTQCLFRTTMPIDLLPVRLEDVRHRRPQSRVDQISLEFRTAPAQVSAVGSAPMRLFFHGETGFWSTLRNWFLRHCTQIEVLSGDDKLGELPVSAIRPVGFAEDEQLLPQSPTEHDAFTAAAEFFAYPEKYAYVEIPPLDKMARPSFQIRFSFERAPKLTRPPVEGDIRLHCGPAINLFECPGEPVRFDPLRPEGLAQAANRKPAEAEVWDLTEVVGLGPAIRREYPPFASFRAHATPHGRYYTMRRTSSASASGTDVYVSIVSPRDAPPITTSEVLSLQVLCSNRAAATRLKIGELSRQVRGSTTSAPFANILPITPPLYPHDDTELVWRLAAHVGISRRGLQDAANLRRLLMAYNFAAEHAPRQGRLNAIWIAAIREVSVQKAVRVHRGAPITGTRATVTLDGTNLSTSGEAFLLGEVLNEVFARRVLVNSFNQLEIVVSPSGERWIWPPRNGSTALI